MAKLYHRCGEGQLLLLRRSPAVFANGRGYGYPMRVNMRARAAPGAGWGRGMVKKGRRRGTEGDKGNMTARRETVRRETRETQIELTLDLDGSGSAELALGIPFLEHMLEQVGCHGMLDLQIRAKGDLAVDAHHTVEDVGIVLGQAFSAALGDKQGIRRYGHACVPLDEALSRVVLDCSGRPGLHYYADFPRPRIGTFDADLIREFFQGFVNHARVTLHIDNLRGRNAHHVAETIFKAFGRSLRMAVEPDPRLAERLPSTKGKL